MMMQHSCKCHLEVVQHLVEVGADQGQTRNDGATPLFMTVRTRHLDIVHHLVEIGIGKDEAILAAEEGGGTQAIMGNGATPCISTLSWGGCSLPGQVRDQIAPNISQLRLITKGLAERQASGENKQVPAAG